MDKTLSNKDKCDLRIRGGFNIRVITDPENYDEMDRNVHQLAFAVTKVFQDWFDEDFVGAMVKKFSDQMYEIDIRYPTPHNVNATQEELEDAVRADP